jgi:Ca-activated chloride channel family protein
MLLITDGEDHDSYPLDAARAAVEAGIRIVSIGFGSEEGSEITLTDPETGARTVLTDRDGRVVRSRLDGDLLREIALLTEGVYIPAGTAALDLDSIVDRHVEPLVTDVADRNVRPVVIEHYRWFVLGALIALVAAVWVGSTRGARRRGA